MNRKPLNTLTLLILPATLALTSPTLAAQTEADTATAPEAAQSGNSDPAAEHRARLRNRLAHLWPRQLAHLRQRLANMTPEQRARFVQEPRTRRHERLDRRGDRIDRRFDRRGDRIDARLDPRGHGLPRSAAAPGGGDAGRSAGDGR
ncbi:MAG: hypothetical protein ACREU7_15055 [Burkholderiales bacterium]